jgi:murein DD-endopeptidase MepM/ murein hydrolase activator NlpD
MPENKYFYYDEDACTFVEVQQRRRGTLLKQASAILVTSLIVAAGLTWGMSQVRLTPQELTLRAENEALQQHLALVSRQISDFAARIDELSEADRELYRTLLEADPISDDVRRMGVGGTDMYEHFNRFSGGTAALLRQTSQTLDQIERQINLQNASYRELAGLASNRSEWMAQLPAILPADGRLVSGYGMRRHPILRVQRMHHGIDIVVPIGTPVYAPGDGVINRTGFEAGYGRYLEIHHPKTGYYTFFAHLSEVPSNMRRGTRVERGQQVALSGNTGRSTGPHLHYEVRDSDGRTLNPLLFIAPSVTPARYRELLEEAESSPMSLD